MPARLWRNRWIGEVPDDILRQFLHQKTKTVQQVAKFGGVNIFLPVEPL
jgi:hypothetical protein